MITSIRSPSQNAVVFVLAARMNVRQLAQILCSSHKLLLDPRFSGPEAISANPPACFALRNRSTSRRTLACTRRAHRLTPIAEPAARPGSVPPAISCLHVCTILPNTAAGGFQPPSGRPSRWRHTEHDFDTVAVDLDSADDGMDDLAHAQPVELVEPVSHLGGKIFQSADDE